MVIGDELSILYKPLELKGQLQWVGDFVGVVSDKIIFQWLQNQPRGEGRGLYYLAKAKAMLFLSEVEEI